MLDDHYQPVLRLIEETEDAELLTAYLDYALRLEAELHDRKISVNIPLVSPP